MAVSRTLAAPSAPWGRRSGSKDPKASRSCNANATSAEHGKVEAAERLQRLRFCSLAPHAVALASKGRLIRCTVRGLTPNRQSPLLARYRVGEGKFCSRRHANCRFAIVGGSKMPLTEQAPRRLDSCPAPLLMSSFNLSDEQRRRLLVRSACNKAACICAATAIWSAP